MTRRNNLIPFLFATATGAVTVAAAIQYRRQKEAALKELAASSRLLDTRLGPIEVAVAGEGDPVVITHGILGGYQQGLVIGEPLVGAGYQVIAPSRFGYLKSPMAEDSSPAAQADRIAALLDVLKIKQPVVVIGVSAGGPPVVEFAARHADRTRALVMMSAVSQPRDIDAEERHTPAISMLLIGYTSDVAMWLMLHYALRVIPFSLAERPTLQSLLDRPELMAMYRRLLWGLWPVSNRRAGVDNDIAQIKRLSLPLTNVSAPTLVLHGTEDQLVPYETGLYTASQIPGAKFVRIERGEHGMSIMQYDEVWPHVLDFLRSTRKAAPKRAAPKKVAPKRPAARKPPARPAPVRKPAAPKVERPVARRRTTRRTP